MPPEILGQILSLVLAASSPDMRLKYAAVSRDWQPHVEMGTFRTLRLDQDRIKEAWKIVTPRRREYVREVQMHVILPGYNPQDVPDSHETADEQAGNNHVFTDAITSLFEILASWTPTAAEKEEIRGKICLRLRAYSHDDDRPTRLFTAHRLSRRWRRSHLDFVKHASFELPALPIISSFYYHECDRQRAPSARTYSEIAARLPNLRSLSWWFPDSDSDLQFRMKTRQQFAEGIASIPQSVAHFTLSAGYRIRMHGHALDSSGRNVCPEGPDRDPLSLAIFQLSQRLETLKLRSVVIGSEAFWPSTSQLPEPQPGTEISFPWLQELDISPSIVSPTGELIFQKHDFGGIDLAVLPQVNSYCLAAARAAACMPSLKRLKLSWRQGMAHMSYKVSEERAEAMLAFSGVEPFDLSDEVKDAWSEVTRARFGDDKMMAVVRDEKLRRPPPQMFDHEQVHLPLSDEVVEAPSIDPELFRGFTYNQSPQAGAGS